LAHKPERGRLVRELKMEHIEYPIFSGAQTANHRMLGVEHFRQNQADRLSALLFSK